MLVISYTMSSMLWLRLLVCLAQIGFMVGALRAGLHNPGMLSSLIFSCLILFVNSIHLVRLLYVKIPITIPDKYKTAYKKKFKRFSPREFIILLHYTQLKMITDDYIIKQHSAADIIFIISGKIHILIENQVITELSGFQLFGEVSFLTNSTSIAAVKALDPVEFCVWTRRELQKLEKKYPEIFYKFYDILLKSLAIKLSNQNKLTVLLHKSS